MSMAEKNRREHPGTKAGESKAHSVAHKHDSHKMASVVNHNHYERNHGFESSKRGEKKLAS